MQTIHTLCRRRDSLHGQAVLPENTRQGTVLTWRAGVLLEDGTLDPLDGVTALILRIVSYGGARPGEFTWYNKSIPAEAFTTPPNAEAVRAKTAWHAQWVLDETETLWPVEDSGSRDYWFEIRAAMTGGEAVLGSGRIVHRGSAGRGDNAYVTTQDLAALLDDASDPYGILTIGDIPLTLGDPDDASMTL